jgi:LysM repeat protein/uncharacterized lipoprotein NlpE involved in copper resistance
MRITCLWALVLVFLISGAVFAAEEPEVPLVSVITPANGSTISGNQIEIAVSFNSTDQQPVSKIKVFLDGKPVTERAYQTPLPSGLCTFKWDTFRTPNGRHKLDFQVFSGDDYLGMVSSQVTVSNETADLAPPKVGITSPKEGEVVAGTTQIVVSASDDSGIEPYVTISVDKALRAMKNRGPYVFDWDTTDNENGPHTISVSASDQVGNRADSKPVRVIVRNPVKMMPLTEAPAPVVEVPVQREQAAQPSSAVPTLPDFPASTATPLDSGDHRQAMVEEYARTIPDMGTVAPESFEVQQTAVPRANLPSVRERVSSAETAAPAQAHESPSPAPAPEEVSAPAVETPAATPAPAPDVAASKPSSMPVLIARAPETELQPVVRLESRLAVPTAPPARRTEPAVRVAGVQMEAEYVVRSGDSVLALAKKFGVPVKSLVAMNDIEDPSLIKIGDKLRIPAADSGMVALRTVFEKAGGTVLWDGQSKSVRAVCPGNDVELKLGSARAVVNDRPINMERPATVESGRTMVGESFVTKTLGMETE